MTLRKLLSLTIVCLLATCATYAQGSFNLINDATVYSGCNCYQLTAAVGQEGGGVYQTNTIDLTNPFDYTFSIYLGNLTGGADGMVFILSTNITQIGITGGGLGYGNLAGNSVGVEYDTYQNGWDPPYNHIAIEVNGQIEHPTGTIAGPVSMLPSQGYADDGNWHTTRITWDPVGLNYSVYFDGNLRLTYNGDIVGTYFGGNPVLNWGWSGSTGGLYNAQRICTNSISSWTGGNNYSTCNLTVPFTDISSSNVGNVNSWAWNFGDTASHTADTSSLENPTHTFTAPGSYLVSLTITDITSCPDTFTHIFVVDTPISLTPTYKEPLCNGGSTGSIALATGGGLGTGTTYTYQWSNGTGSDTLSNVAAGPYGVTVSDGVCTATGSYVLSQPPALQLSLVNVVNDSCFGYCDGEITVNATNGTPGAAGYSYLWSNGTTGPTDSNLCAIAYTVTVKDSNLCTASLSHTITAPPSNIALTLDSVNVKCFGQATGQAAVSAVGGTPGYTYQWSNSGNTAIITDLAAGPYTVTVKDQHGCGVVDSIVVNQPASALALQTSADSITCSGLSNGKAFVTASGATPGYTYHWSGGTGALTDSIVGLTAGPYTVSVTDTLGCTMTATVTIASPQAITITTTDSAATCGNANGEITATAAGGKGGFQYLWSTRATTASISALPGDSSYSVTVTDASGCTGTQSVSITQQPGISAIAPTVTDTCAQGKGRVSVTVSSGTPPYTYSWTPSIIDTTKVDSGAYTLLITDSLGCTLTVRVVVANDDSACAPLLVFGNAFTPNNDQVNDNFTPKYSAELNAFHMRIYDRWGQLVYESSDPTQGWDGKYKGEPQPIGNFIWFADYSFRATPDKTISQTGGFSLFR